MIFIPRQETNTLKTKQKKATVKKTIAYLYTVFDNKFAQQFYEPEEATPVDEVVGVFTGNQSFYNYLTS